MSAYQFDHGASGGLGVRSLAYAEPMPGATSVPVQAHQIGDGPGATGLDAFARATTEISGLERLNLSAQGTARGAQTVELRVGSDTALDRVNFPAASARTSGVWSRDLWLPGGGTFALQGLAAHPSGLYTAKAQNTFSLNPRHVAMSSFYDSSGQTVSRVAGGGAAVGGRTQTLTWDGKGRLIKMVQEEAFGQIRFDWTAIYDALGRRIQTQTEPRAGGTGQPVPQSIVERSWFDPEEEFLEVAIETFRGTGPATVRERWWKVHGPDLSGNYGGLAGLGGLEALVDEASGRAVGLVDDCYGHILGFAKALNGTGGTFAANPLGAPFPAQAGQIVFEWNVSRFTGYGPLPGNWAPSLAEGVAPWRTFGWRGKRIDVTGFYHLGARYYEPNSGRFLSPDPLGHGASMGLYDYAGGDPINFVDPRGRSALKAGAGFVTSAGGSVMPRFDGMMGSFVQTTAGLLGASYGGRQPLRGTSVLALHVYSAVQTIAYYGRVISGYRARQNQWSVDSPVFLGVTDTGENYSPERLGSILADTEIAALARGGVKMSGAGIGGPPSGPMIPATVGPQAATASMSVAASGATPFRPPTALFNSNQNGSNNPVTALAAGRGSRLHADQPGRLPEQLRQRYPETQFEFTKPGKVGQDVQVTGGKHPSVYPGSHWPEGVNRADFKPNTPGGHKTFRRDQATKWSEDTHMLTYDPATGQLQ